MYKDSNCFFLIKNENIYTPHVWWFENWKRYAAHHTYTIFIFAAAIFLKHLCMDEWCAPGRKNHHHRSFWMHILFSISESKIFISEANYIDVINSHIRGSTIKLYIHTAIELKGVCFLLNIFSYNPNILIYTEIT